jgi:hypothetical protein
MRCPSCNYDNPADASFCEGMRSEAGVDLPSVQSIGESWGAILQEMWDCNWLHKSRCLRDRFFD